MEQTYQNEGQVNAVESSNLPLPSQPILSSPLWDQESHHDNWPRNDMHQRFGIVSCIMLLGTLYNQFMTYVGYPVTAASKCY